MAAAAARSSLRAAATETRVRACSGTNTKIEKTKNQSSMRVHGLLIATFESRKIGDTRARWGHYDEPPPSCRFDHRMEIADLSLFRNHVACRDLVHRMLAEGPGTGDYDLAADNWEDFEPRNIATAILAKFRRATEDAGSVVSPYAFDIKIDLHISLFYSEPKELLLACKEAAAETGPARVPARRRKRRREPADELCAICLVDLLETKEEETVTLPCSHAFHSRCIGPWFHHASTCPTCRHDAANSTIRHVAGVDEVDLETVEGNDR